MASEVRWALCRWFDENSTDLIHPDDLPRFQQRAPLGDVFTVLADEGEYTVIGSGAEEFRVRPESLRFIEPEESWLIDIDDHVAVNDREYTGTVIAVAWHHKERKPFYKLEVAGRAQSKRYWPDDLERISGDAADTPRSVPGTAPQRP